jgi:N,N'-diacetyllegionaminate synthase
MMLTIDNRPVGPGQPALIIAEIGVNHDGSPARALELVDAAAGAGADAVKLQIFRADALMHPAGMFARYQRQSCAEADPRRMLQGYELPVDALAAIVGRIRSRGMIPLATPFSPPDVRTIDELDLPAIKIASPDLVNLPLLQRAGALGRPLLLSTGAADLAEVAQAVRWLAQLNASFALLHCISSYPTSAADANLSWIAELSTRFGVVAGFSDHTTEVLAGALAVIAGACIIEKHLTHDRSAPGPDHAASADPQQFAEYVRAVRLAEQMKGQPGRRVLAAEEDVRRVSRQSLVLTRPVARGEAVTEDHLTTRRPGTGIPAAELPRILGRRPGRHLEAGTMLEWDMLESPGDPML